MWWTEYVIRNNGAAHFRSPFVEMRWTEFLLIDVLSFLLFLTLAVLFGCYFILRYIFIVCSKNVREKIKKM